MDTIRIRERSFPVTEQVNFKSNRIPVVDIPQISDEKWNRMAARHAYFDVCPDCGAHLDPCEKCDCEEALVK